MLPPRLGYWVSFGHVVLLSAFHRLEHCLRSSALIPYTTSIEGLLTSDDHAPASFGPASIQSLVLLARYSPTRPDTLLHRCLDQAVWDLHAIWQRYARADELTVILIHLLGLYVAIVDDMYA